MRERGIQKGEEALGEASVWAAGARPTRDAATYGESLDGMPSQQLGGHALDARAAAVKGKTPLQLFGAQQGPPGRRRQPRAPALQGVARRRRQ